MNRDDKIKILSAYKEFQELKSMADKRIKELQLEIKRRFKPGKYGQYLLNFEVREVKEYVVPARTDHIVKVSKMENLK
jgi:hypothetical protein